MRSHHKNRHFRLGSNLFASCVAAMCASMTWARPALGQLAPGVEAAADQEIVVTATSTESRREEVGSAITVIGRDEIERRKETSVAEVLRGVPGLDVVTSGGRGGNVSVFLRGANPEHTLILIDGIEANNPVTPGRSFNFASLTLDNVERIEVLRGPQSSLYGSDALGGVINVITKRGKGQIHGSASFEGGSYDSFTGTGSVSGEGAGVDYSLGVTQEHVDGVSAASVRDGNSEDDPFRNTSVSSRVGVQASEQLRFNHYLRYNTARTSIDNRGGVGADDPNRRLHTKALFTRFEGETQLMEGRLTSKAGVSYSAHDFDDNNDPDELAPLDRLRSEFKGSILEFNLVNSLAVGEHTVLTAGLETEEERGESVYESQSSFGPYSESFEEKDARTNGYFAQAQFDVAERLFTTVGARIDDHSRFGSEVTWRVAPSYLLKETGTRFLGSVGTGYKAPSLYQLHSQYGRADLDPEESLGWDVGFEQDLGKLSLGATYFWNDFDHLISFDPSTFVYTNIAQANTEGVEIFWRAAASETLSLGMNYTYTDSEDEATGLPLLRRARHKVGGDVSIRPTPEWNLNINASYIGRRVDTDFSTFPESRKTLGGYTLVNVAASYDVSSALQLFARLENLLDKEYEDVLGYGTMGLGGYLGVKFSF